MLLLTVASPKQESVSLPTKKTIAKPVTPELGLVRKEITTPTRAVTEQRTHQIMATNTSKPWDTSWCSDKESNELSTKKPSSHAAGFDLHVDVV